MIQSEALPESVLEALIFRRTIPTPLSRAPVLLMMLKQPVESMIRKMMLPAAIIPSGIACMSFQRPIGVLSTAW